ncbi:MAG: hypothetical protein K8S56_10140, partial [Candidatus Cloacimonetes bacterium]|nr:hypothetical protein [Candidatus Cloacimonadota bacterium]
MKPRYIYLLASVILLWGCAGASSPRQATKEIPHLDKVTWWRVQDDSDIIHSFGFGREIQPEFSRNSAYENAVNQPTAYITRKLQAMSNQSRLSASVNTAKWEKQRRDICIATSRRAFQGAPITRQQQIKVKWKLGYRILSYVRLTRPKRDLDYYLLLELDNHPRLK